MPTATTKKEAKTAPSTSYPLHLRLQCEEGEVLFYAVHGDDLGKDGEIPCVFQSDRDPTDIRGGFVVMSEEAHPVSEEALLSVADMRNNYAHVIEVARTYLASNDRWKEGGGTTATSGEQRR